MGEHEKPGADIQEFAEGAYCELSGVSWDMPRRKSGSQHHEVRCQNQKANSLRDAAFQTAKIWRKHHLTYDQTKHVVEQLIETAYGHSSRYGFLVKMLFYTGARVSEFVQIRIEQRWI